LTFANENKKQDNVLTPFTSLGGSQSYSNQDYVDIRETQKSMSIEASNIKVL
jgi:hypothetical protein